MNEIIDEYVSVNLVYDHTLGSVTPQHLKWHNRRYKIIKVGLHYTIFKGKTLIHMFAVCDEHHYFLLAFNTETLTWKLQQITDEQMS